MAPNFYVLHTEAVYTAGELLQKTQYLRSEMSSKLFKDQHIYWAGILAAQTPVPCTTTTEGWMFIYEYTLCILRMLYNYVIRIVISLINI